MKNRLSDFSRSPNPSKVASSSAGAHAIRVSRGKGEDVKAEPHGSPGEEGSGKKITTNDFADFLGGTTPKRSSRPKSLTNGNASGETQATGAAFARSRKYRRSNWIPLVRAEKHHSSPESQPSDASASLPTKKRRSKQIPERVPSPGSPPSTDDGTAESTGEGYAPLSTKKKTSKQIRKQVPSPGSLTSNDDGKSEATIQASASLSTKKRSKQIPERVPSPGSPTSTDDGTAESTGEGYAPLYRKKKRSKQIPERVPSPGSNDDGKAEATGEASAPLPKNPKKKKRSKESPDRVPIPGSPSSNGSGKPEATREASALSKKKKRSKQIPERVPSPGSPGTSNDDGKAEATVEASAPLYTKKKRSKEIPLVRVEKRPSSPESSPSSADGKAQPTTEAKKMGKKISLMRAVKRPSRPKSLPSNTNGKAQPTGEASAPLSRKNERGKEEPEKIQALLERDERDLTIEGAAYLFSLPLSVAPGDEVFWSYCNEQQLNEVNHRLALYRLKDYKQLYLGKEEDIAELKVKYPPHVLESECYFEHLEESLEWYFHPEHTKTAGLDDYQRLVLRNDNYVDWDSYCLTYHTYQGDLDYVKYCDQMIEEIKWIEDKVVHDAKQWQRYERRACFQAFKIGSGFSSSLYRHSIMRAYNDYRESVWFDFVNRKDFDYLFLEIWKRVAKQKADYYCALEEIYQKKLFPLLMGRIKLEIEKLPPSFHGWMKKKYDTYVACIDEKISEEDCYLLIKGSMKKMFPEPKAYLDYARKKLDIAARIGLIPKESSLDVTTEGREGNGDAKPATAY